MAIYRPPRSPWRGRVIAVGVGLLIGGVIVWALRPDAAPTPEEEAAALRGALIAAEGSLEIVAIEYGEAVDDGRVVAEAEYNGALAALQSSRERYAAVRGDLIRETADEIDAAYEEIEELMDTRVAEKRVKAALEELSALLEEGNR